MITATATAPINASRWNASSQKPVITSALDGFTPSSTIDWVPPKRPTFASSTPTLPDGKTFAVSDFAAKRHRPGTGCAYFTGSKKELMELIKDGWDKREPGTGRSNLDEVVVVPVKADKFMTTVVEVDQHTQLAAGLTRRRSHEEPYVRVSARGREPEPAKFAKVVLYSADTLGKNNERSADTDWEVVSLIASPVENEPMDPVTMMRNMRGKPGGSQVNYTADQLLDSIEFWSKHVKLSPGEHQ